VAKQAAIASQLRNIKSPGGNYAAGGGNGVRRRHVVVNRVLRDDFVDDGLLRDILKRVKWDPKVVLRKIKSARFDRDSARQVNILGGQAARVISSRLV